MDFFYQKINTLILESKIFNESVLNIYCELLYDKTFYESLY